VSKWVQKVQLRHLFFGTSLKYFKRDINALLRLGADTKPFLSVIANRQSTHFQGHAQTIIRLCRHLQSSSQRWRKVQGYDIDRVVQKVAEVLEIEPEEIWKPGNQPPRVKARSLVYYWAV
jgi:hypothetical protein